MRKRLEHSGLPIYYDDQYVLHFEEGLTCGGSGTKEAEKMRGLLYREENLNGEEICYSFYRDIVFEKDRELFESRDYRYDITVIMPGDVGGECKKTSGHFHGEIEGQTWTYPEIYEVLEGEITFLLQKTRDFEREDPVFESVRAVRVQAGQAIVIPPFCGHGSINTGDGVGMFSNIAVVSCPLFYEPVKKKHGLSYYIVKENGQITYIKNSAYVNLPELEVVEPGENEELGIVFGKPVYQEFVRDPERFEYLRRPEAYVDRMERMLEKR